MKRTYGLQVEYIRRPYGTNQIVAKVLAREDAAASPINCSNEGERSIWGAPKHMEGLMLNTLQVRAFFSDDNKRVGDPAVEFADVYYTDIRKARAMVRTLSRVETAMRSANWPTEHGDVVQAVIKALKLDWCVICTHAVPNSSYSMSQWKFVHPRVAADMFRASIQTHLEAKQEA